jgi:hypothetical protein
MNTTICTPRHEAAHFQTGGFPLGGRKGGGPFVHSNRRKLPADDPEQRICIPRLTSARPTQAQSLLAPPCAKLQGVRGTEFPDCAHEFKEVCQ